MYPSFLEYLQNEYKGPFSATDIIGWYEDRGKKGIPLILRGNFPFGLALPGGIAEAMNYPSNARKESKEEMNLRIKFFQEYLLSPIVLSERNQDMRAHISSIVYAGMGTGELKAGDDARAVKLFTPDEICELLTRPVLTAGTRPKDFEEGWSMPHYKVALAQHLQHVYSGRIKELENLNWRPTREQKKTIDTIVSEYVAKLESGMYGVEDVR
jgi:8-oxo-dGTP diphosphatase